MAEFWHRIATVETDGVTFTYPEMEFTFQVVLDEQDGEPPEAEIVFYNLRQETENRLKAGNNLTLRAGYEGRVGTLLTGEIINVAAYYDGVDRVCEVQVIDTAKYLNTSINRTFNEGTTAMTILTTVLADAGLEAGALILPGEMNITYPSGRTFSKRLKSVISEVVKDAGAKWYVKNNMVYIVPKDHAEGTDLVLNKDYGMIRSPTRLDSDDGPEWEVTSLLNPQIQIGTIVRIESRTASGEYKVLFVTHKCSKGDYITTAEVSGL